MKLLIAGSRGTQSMINCMKNEGKECYIYLVKDIISNT